MRKFENITDISEVTNFESLEEFVTYLRGVKKLTYKEMKNIYKVVGGKTLPKEIKDWTKRIRKTLKSIRIHLQLNIDYILTNQMDRNDPQDRKYMRNRILQNFVKGYGDD